MNIIVADDEEKALEILAYAVKSAEPSAAVSKFSNGNNVLEYAKKNECEIAFLDIQMNGIDGISLAKKLKILNPKINIIFSTGYSEYAINAINLRASGYLLKPITAEKVREEIENLRYPVLQNKSEKLYIQTFGNFEIFADGKPLQFKYYKSKELLAYLVDRHGAICTNGEIISVLWEHDENLKGKMSYFKSVRRELLNVLKNHNLGDIIIQQRGALGIDVEKVYCDYYEWLKGNIDGINAYHGEYMKQYPWCEFREPVKQFTL